MGERSVWRLTRMEFSRGLLNAPGTARGRALRLLPGLGNKGEP